jgi:hypothetical protein
MPAIGASISILYDDDISWVGLGTNVWTTVGGGPTGFYGLVTAIAGQVITMQRYA